MMKKSYNNNGKEQKKEEEGKVRTKGGIFFEILGKGGPMEKKKIPTTMFGLV
jgi:hypothetical protein